MNLNTFIVIKDGKELSRNQSDKKGQVVVIKRLKQLFFDTKKIEIRHIKLVCVLIKALLLISVWVVSISPAVLAFSRPNSLEQQVDIESLDAHADKSFDVKHYDIRLTIDIPSKTISGTVTIRALAVSDGLNALRLDLSNHLTVDSVMSGSANLAFSHRDGRLDITLPQAYKVGFIFEITIKYEGKAPSDRSPAPGFFFSSRRSVPVIASFGLPYNAPDWLPCKDGPADKADSADIAITLPQELVVVSNGNLVKETNNGDGTKTSRWAVRYPIYPDVISIAATDYATFTLPYKSISGVSMDMTFYVYPEDLEKAKIDFSVLPSMMKHYTAMFGEYPFIKEKYGVAEGERGWKEHQTIPSYPYQRLTGDHQNDFIIGHELAHQWFGNSISLLDRSHFWLNEGLSDYAYWLWLERTRGRMAYMSEMEKASQTDYSGPIYIKDTKTERVKLLSLRVFSRCALVVHMLRGVMGDAAFFRALKRYVKTYSYKNVLTEDYQAICEKEYGKPLDWFFRRWVYGVGKPEYEYRWSVNKQGNKYVLNLTINQVQITALFSMPLDVTVTTVSGKKAFVVFNKLKTETFEFSFSEEVTKVDIDPEGWVWKKLKQNADSGLLR